MLIHVYFLFSFYGRYTRSTPFQDPDPEIGALEASLPANFRRILSPPGCLPRIRTRARWRVRQKWQVGERWCGMMWNVGWWIFNFTLSTPSMEWNFPDVHNSWTAFKLTLILLSRNMPTRASEPQWQRNQYNDITCYLSPGEDPVNWQLCRACNIKRSCISV